MLKTNDVASAELVPSPLPDSSPTDTGKVNSHAKIIVTTELKNDEMIRIDKKIVLKQKR